MKTVSTFFATAIIFLFAACSLCAQNITNTLGAGGVFYIKDASTNIFTLTQSTGTVNILKGLRLEATENSTTTGIIFKGADRFIHDFKPTLAIGYNTFVGLNSGNFTMSFVSGSDASFNTGVGYNSLAGLTAGCFNTALGISSLLANSLGNYNTALGGQSLFNNLSGSYNTASGYQSLFTNSSGNYNTASGYQALYNSIGNYNTAFGSSALYTNSSGSNNTAVGYISLYANSTGGDNTAMGYKSLYANSSGNDNTTLGYQSLYTNTSGSYNTASGSQALNANSLGYYNTASGYQSLFTNSIGYDNTATGYYSLYNSTGSSNTAIGSNSGYLITSGGNLTCLGFNAQPTTAVATNQITLGDSYITSLRCAQTTITALSDARDKKNITDLNLGLDFLMKIKPRLSNWDKREWYDKNISDGTKMQATPTAGFIAQELDEVQTTTNSEWLKLVLKDNPQKLEATPGNLLPIMVKAIQELKKENEELKVNSEKLIVRNEELRELVGKIQASQQALLNEVVKLREDKSETKITSSNTIINLKGDSK